MKHIYDLGNYKKAVLWKGDVPEFGLEPQEERKTSLPIKEPTPSNYASIALEIKLPKNSSYYALLCAQYVPDTSSEIVIELKLINDIETVFQSDLVLTEEIYEGICVEYADCIIKTARKMLIHAGWQHPGRIVLTGAHSLFGSSEAIFSKATEIVIPLLLQALSSVADGNEETIILNHL